MIKVLSASILPVVSAALNPVRIVTLIRVGVCDLLEVFGRKVVSRILSPPLAGRSLLLLESVLL